MHRSTKMIRGIPMIIVSAWSVMLMGVNTLMHQYYGDDFLEHCTTDKWLGPDSYVTCFSLVETIVLAFVHTSYISK